MPCVVAWVVANMIFYIKVDKEMFLLEFYTRFDMPRVYHLVTYSNLFSNCLLFSTKLAFLPFGYFHLSSCSSMLGCYNLICHTIFLQYSLYQVVSKMLSFVAYYYSRCAKISEDISCWKLDYNFCIVSWACYGFYPLGYIINFD